MRSNLLKQGTVYGPAGNRAGIIMDRLKRIQDSKREREHSLNVLKSLTLNVAIMQELEFETKLKALMKRYRKTLADIKLLEALSVVPRQHH